MGEVWRVETDTGLLALKSLFSWADYPDRPADVEVQLAAADAGVRLPRPLLAGDRAVIDASGGRYRAYEWAELGPRLPVPLTTDVAGEAGRTLGVIHSLGLPLEDTAAPGDDPVDDWYRTPPSKDRLVSLVRAGMGEARPWAPVVIAMLGAIDELLAAVAGGSGELTVCHRDFTVENVLPAVDGDGLVVIDWENAGPLGADQELAAAVLEFATGAGAVDEAAANAFLVGYQRAGGTAHIEGATSFATVVYTALNYMRVLMEQSMEDDGHREFADATLLDELTRYLPNLMAVLPALAAR